METTEPFRRDQYSYLQAITTRWSDNDVYGHVNNVVYFSYFDTVVNQYLIEKQVRASQRGEDIGMGGGNACRYFQRIRFRGRAHAGIQLQRLGTSWVISRIALFCTEQTVPAAQGRFVQVYLARATRKP